MSPCTRSPRTSTPRRATAGGDLLSGAGHRPGGARHHPAHRRRGRGLEPRHLHRRPGEIGEKLAATDRLVNSNRGPAIFNDLIQADDASMSFSQDVIALAEQGKKAEATELLYGERYKSQATLLAAAKTMALFQVERMIAGGDAAQKVYDDATLSIVAVSVLAEAAGARRQSSMSGWRLAPIATPPSAHHVKARLRPMWRDHRVL